MSEKPKHGQKVVVVMPAYNEEPARVFAGLAATYESLERTGSLQRFDFFLLSDTNDPDIWVREEVAFAHARQRPVLAEKIPRFANRPHDIGPDPRRPPARPRPRARAPAGRS